jgi:Plasmid pRiA4b ORF-3-like protein
VALDSSPASNSFAACSRRLSRSTGRDAQPARVWVPHTSNMQRAADNVTMAGNVDCSSACRTVLHASAEDAAAGDGDGEQVGEVSVGEGGDVVHHVLVGLVGAEVVDAQLVLDCLVQVGALVITHVVDDALGEDFARVHIEDSAAGHGITLERFGEVLQVHGDWFQSAIAAHVCECRRPCGCIRRYTLSLLWRRRTPGLLIEASGGGLMDVQWSGSFEIARDEALVLPVADADAVARGAASAPVVGWLRTLAGWVGGGRPFGSGGPARLSREDFEQVASLPGWDRLGAADSDTQAILCDLAVRWALQTRLLSLRSGVLRVAKRSVAWLDAPEVLWFRAFTALQCPDRAFTDLLSEYGSSRVRWHEPIDAVGELLRCLATGPLDDDAVQRTYASRYGAHLASTVGETRVLILLAEALGLIDREDTGVRTPGCGDWRITALGRAVDALQVMPFTEVAGEDDELAELCLLRRPAEQVEPGIEMKVTLSRLNVWRRLSVPGELTMHGLHLAIQSSLGWSGEHLHIFEAGPFRFSSGSGWHRLDDTIPTEFPTLSDLYTLGIREFRYEYDLGESWVHEIVLTAEIPEGESLMRCLAGDGRTPAEDGQDWREDGDGNWVHDPVPAGDRAFDLARINRDLAILYELD